jgi:hypothetical protein
MGKGLRMKVDQGESWLYSLSRAVSPLRRVWDAVCLVREMSSSETRSMGTLSFLSALSTFKHVDEFDTFPGYVEIWAENRRFCQMSRTDSFPIRDMGLSGVGCDHGASSFRIILPLSVRRYFWSRLVGLSGMVISISLRRSANSELGS